MRRYLMKYSLTPKHLIKCIYLAYMACQYEAIFLRGIPEVRGSLPHA